MAVRDKPIINDATLEDAREAGLMEVAQVISSGSVLPGTILEETSAAFQEWFKKADVIISKGQGNFETLFSVSDPRLFFLLRIKCETMANLADQKMGELVLPQMVVFLLGLAQKGRRVGLLDLDLHGPSVPTMLGITSTKIEEGPVGLIPVESHGLKVMSIGFLLENNDDAVAWRGPRKNIMIKYFLRQVDWGELDYLIIDTPPGTGDELMALIENAGDLKGAIVVTTPQKVAAVDVRKAITFCKDLKIPILGLVENMSGLVCSKCGEVTEFFPRGAVDQICKDMDVACISAVPMDSKLANAADVGEVECDRAALLKIVNHLIEEK